MSRKPLHRALPPLAKVVPNRATVLAQDNRTAAVRDALRQAIGRLRTNSARPFYAMREVAAFFDTSCTVVARVYHQLDREGLLLPLRGSKTLLAPRKMQPRSPIRGVVGIPIWVHGFTLTDWRHFFTRLEEELRRYHFVADVIFFSNQAYDDHSLVERCVAHQLDHLIWLDPISSGREAIETLVDCGVRVVSLGEEVDDLPGRPYRLSWQHAVRQGLRQWKRAGLSTVIIPQMPSDAPLHHRLKQLLRQEGLLHRVWPVAETEVASCFAALNMQPHEGIVFEFPLVCLSLCQQALTHMIELCRRHRVMLADSVNIPAPLVKGIEVDMAAMDWDKVIDWVVNDLVDGAPPASRPVHTFRARWLPRVPLSRFALPI